MRTPPGAVSSPALSLAELEQMALRTHPSLMQAAIKVEEARGRALQAGLHPNPFVVYEGRHLGADNTPGLQGGFVQQPIITGGKLRFNRARFDVEVEIARWMMLEQHYLVLNHLRLHFNEILSLQRLLDMHVGLIRLADDLVRLAQEKAGPDDASEIDVLMARREARELRRMMANVEVRYVENWRELAAAISRPDLAPVRLEGTLESDAPLRSWEAIRDHLLASSPEIRIAELRVRREQFSWERERRENIPNLAVRLGNAFDYRRDQTVPFGRLYVEVPLWDRNQGNLLTAEQNLLNARSDRDRLWLILQQRLARVFGRYELSLVDLRSYREETAEARRLLELSVPRYREEEGITFSGVRQSLSAYVTALVRAEESLLELRQAEVALDGLLLTEEPVPLGELRPPREGLQQPMAPPAGNLPMRTIYP